MPSIQDVLLAQEAQKSPFIGLLEGIAGGVQTAQNKALENAKVLIQLQRQAEEEARLRQQDAQAKELIRQTEANTQQGLKTVGTAGTPAEPAPRLKKKITYDEKGYGKVSFDIEEPKPLEPIDSYEKALAQQYKEGKITLEKFAELKAAGTGTPAQFVGIQDGKPVFFNPKTKTMETGALPGQGPLTATNQSESQANAKLYATRLEDADKQINDLATRFDLTSASAGIQGKLPNIAKSEEVQSFEQAKRNFLNAVLRRESGAVISPSEFKEGNQQYFPQFGDKPEVLTQKTLNRKKAIEGLRNAAGIFTPESKTGGGAGKTTKIGRFDVTVEP